MNSSKKKWIVGLLVLLIAFGFARLYYRVTDDFRISNISYEMPFHPEWAIEPLPADEQQQVDRILSQEFSYLGKGAQSYAFVSDDGKYVVKFFKFKHLRPALLAGILPRLPFIGDYQDRQIARKARKLNGVFKSYKLAFDTDKNEAALIFVQLNPNQVHKELVVRDKIGFRRSVDLGSVAYILQEKGETLRGVLSDLLEDGNVQVASQRIAQVFDLYITEYNKGIYDHDHGVLCNIGFIGDRPMHLDVGKLLADKQIYNRDFAKEDLLKVANKIQDWVKSNYPQYANEIQKGIEAKLSAIFQEQIEL